VKRFLLRLSLVLGLALVFLTVTFWTLSADPPAPGEDPPVVFWSDQGPVGVERAVGLGPAEAGGPEALLRVLLAGPTSEERARGLRTAIPRGTQLQGVQRSEETAGATPGLRLVVRLEVPPAALQTLDHESFEAIVQQIALTLEPAGWRDLRIQTRHPTTGRFVPLADFLPPVEVPSKESDAAPADGGERTLRYVGQPPAPGQGQPQGALTGKTIYVSAGHGWQWNDDIDAWRTQRPPYPYPPYVGPIIEDHNNAEAVNQYLLQYLWNAGAMVWPVRERDMNPAEAIVNNDDDSGYSESGSWITSGSSGYDLNVPGQTYRYATTVTGTATATATWSTVLPGDAPYAIYVWYRPGANRAADARYTVHHAGGETTVTVDQRHHGLTWRYIGTYGFQGGVPVTVTLSNRSDVSDEGQVVIADAVRFGGGTFDSLHGIQTTAPAPPDKPWWEVATFYYAQRMGMSQPNNDVVARPIYARWEHAGTGDDAVYISWHTNGVSGYQWDSRGTVSIIHNGYGNPVTPGSAELRDAVHGELVSDIQAGWDHTWPGYTRTMNLGELRLLWDDELELDEQIPGALIEIAYHDHPDDTDALKEPTFEMLAARAIYQGIVAYFAERDAISLPLLPEPPTHLRAQNAGGGQVQLSWRPSPTDAVGLRGDAATSYRVYTSTDGLGWSNGITAPTTAYTLTGLAPGQLLFVRVSAANAGGESFPTEVLAVRAGDPAPVLLVNGFDRLNRTMLLPDYDPVEGYNMRMFLEQMNRYDYIIHHAQVISHPFDSASNEAVADGDVSLLDYGVVDWILGEESYPDQTLSAAERAALEDYLDHDRALFISGSELAWALDDQGQDPAFYHDYLHAAYAGDDAGTYEVAPAPGSIFAALDPFRFDAPAMYDADYPDQLTPYNGGTAALTYQGGGGGVAAVQFVSGCQRLVHFGFPFETIRPAQRAAVMARVIDFLDLCLEPPVDTAILSPLDGGAYREKPAFHGSAEAGAGTTLDRVEVQVRREADGLYWRDGLWGAGMWLTASGTAVWSYTLPTLDQQGDYTLRARAWTSGGDVDDTPAEARFSYDSVAPDVVQLTAPDDGATVDSTGQVLLRWQALDDEGTPISYTLQLDGQFYPTTQTVFTATHLGPGQHGWGVQAVDAAANASQWVTRTFSIRQYRSMLPLILRNHGQVPCTDLIVNGGFEQEQGWTLNRLAVYDTATVHSGQRSARVGIPPDEPGAVVWSSISQIITLPLGSEATLSLWTFPFGEQMDPGDMHYVILHDPFGNAVILDTWQSDARAWQERHYDLTPYLGQIVTLYIGSENDGDDDTASIFIDDARLEVCP